MTRLRQLWFIYWILSFFRSTARSYNLESRNIPWLFFSYLYKWSTNLGQFGRERKKRKTKSCVQPYYICVLWGRKNKAEQTHTYTRRLINTTPLQIFFQHRFENMAIPSKYFSVIAAGFGLELWEWSLSISILKLYSNPTTLKCTNWTTMLSDPKTCIAFICFALIIGVKWAQHSPQIDRI